MVWAVVIHTRGGNQVSSCFLPHSLIQGLLLKFTVFSLDDNQFTGLQANITMLRVL